MKHFKPLLVTASLIALAMTNCTSNKPKGIDKANLDASVTPNEDFYQYACGGWMAANPLKDEYSRFGSFDQLAENNQKQLRELVDGLDRTTAAPGSNAQKIADLYALGMDSVALNEQGNSAILADLAIINAIEKDNLASTLASMPYLNAFYGNYVTADMIDASQNAMYLVNTGMGLGDRDYYIVDGEDEQKIRDAYTAYLTKLATLSGYDAEQAAQLAANVLAIETRLAQASMSREESRNPQAQYNPMTIETIAQNYPALNVVEYFTTEGIDSISTAVVTEPKYMAEANAIVKEMPIEAIRDYVAAAYMRSAAPYLSDDFVDARFEFNKVLSGVQQQQPRWKRVLNVTDSSLGEALGELYVEKYFPQSSKEKMLTLVGNLQTALGQHIDQLTWMSDSTKARAHEKLNSFTVKIGFPDKWRDYTALVIDPNLTYWDNIKAVDAFELDYNLSDFGKPVDNTRWFMTPQTVNAYYNPSTNEICFPAGILQQPFFDPEADDAVNYGAIGVVIGHEMTHGFDDQGRQFDKDGNLADWWTEADAEAFNALADQLAAQFDEIVVIDDIHANGRFTLGENIADQGGLRVAHTAYHNSLNGTVGEDIDGFSPDQRFYLAYANVWAGNIRDEEIKRRTKIDPHSLGKWRVNASLRNIEPFFQAFAIQEGDPMYRPDSTRVIIW